MLKRLATGFAVLALAALVATMGLYALLVLGSRRGVEYYYGR
jgi:hypothetical protein